MSSPSSLYPPLPRSATKPPQSAICLTCKTTKLSVAFCGSVMPKSENSVFSSEEREFARTSSTAMRTRRGRIRGWKGGRSIQRDFIRSAKRILTVHGKCESAIPASTRWYLRLVGQQCGLCAIPLGIDSCSGPLFTRAQAPTCILFQSHS